MRSPALLLLLPLLVPAVARADKPTGVIKGTVIFEGEPPERAPQPRSVDPECAKTAKLSDDVIVTHGKLKDAIVRVVAGVRGTFPAPTTPALFDQHECTYTPHVLGVLAGQRLAIRNSDNTFHNVRGTVGTKALWNSPQAPHAPDLAPDHVAASGEVIELHCDVHAWMHAYAVVADNPFFAVTGDDGTFELDGLAPGTYTIEAWHPVLGTRTMKVIIGNGARGKVTARLSYRAQDLK